MTASMALTNVMPAYAAVSENRAGYHVDIDEGAEISETSSDERSTVDHSSEETEAEERVTEEYSSEETAGSEAGIDESTSTPDEALNDESGYSIMSSASENMMSTLSVDAVFGTEIKPSLLKDGKRGLVKGQKWFVGESGASSDKKRISVNKKGIAKVKKTGNLEMAVGGSVYDVKVVDAKISTKAVNLDVGESQSVKLEDKEGGSLTDEGFVVSWMTSNPDVAQVYDGQIFATGLGNTKVYAYVGGKPYRVSVTVSDASASTYLMDIPNNKKRRIRIPEAQSIIWNYEKGKIHIPSGGKTVKAKELGVTNVSGNDRHGLLVYTNKHDVDTSYGISAVGKKNQYTVKMAAGDKLFINLPNTHELPIWKTKKPEVAAVSEYGVIAAENPGTSILTAKIAGKKVKLIVSVGNERSYDIEALKQKKFKKIVVDGINGNDERYVYIYADGRVEKPDNNGRNGSGNGSGNGPGSGSGDDSGNGSGNDNGSGNGDGNGGENPSDDQKPVAKPAFFRVMYQTETDTADTYSNVGIASDSEYKADNSTVDVTKYCIPDGGILTEEEILNTGSGSEKTPFIEKNSKLTKWNKEHSEGWHLAGVKAVNGDLKVDDPEGTHNTDKDGKPVTSPDNSDRADSLKLDPSVMNTVFLFYERNNNKVNFHVMDDSKGKTITRDEKFGLRINDYPNMKDSSVAYKKGYSFDGWYTAETGGTRIDESKFTTPNAAVTDLYAHWKPNTYKLTLKLNNVRNKKATGNNGSDLNAVNNITVRASGKGGSDVRTYTLKNGEFCTLKYDDNVTLQANMNKSQLQDVWFYASSTSRYKIYHNIAFNGWNLWAGKDAPSLSNSSSSASGFKWSCAGDINLTCNGTDTTSRTSAQTFHTSTGTYYKFTNTFQPSQVKISRINTGVTENFRFTSSNWKISYDGKTVTLSGGNSTQRDRTLKLYASNSANGPWTEIASYTGRQGNVTIHGTTGGDEGWR